MHRMLKKVVFGIFLWSTVGAANNFTFTARHIAGILNDSADALPDNNHTLFLSLPQPSGTTPPRPTSQGGTRAGSQLQPALDISKLDQAVQGYLKACIAPMTKSAYWSTQQRYTDFCIRVAIRASFPLQEEILCKYVSYLSLQPLEHCTIKLYLSVWRIGQSQQGLGNPFQAQDMPLLQYVLAGIKHSQTHSHPPK